MLVKFLSFVASVLGTQRYKTILLSCFAVVLSLTGVTALAVFRESAPEDQAAASAVDKSDENDTKTESNSPQLSDNRKQSAKDTQGVTSQSQTPQNQDNNPTDKADNSEPNAKADVKVTLSSDSIAINAGTDANNPVITASTSDKSDVLWNISIDDQDAQALRVMNSSKTNAAVFTFGLQADKDVPKGKQYKITLTARDTVRGISIPTTITVTVQ